MRQAPHEIENEYRSFTARVKKYRRHYLKRAAMKSVTIIEIDRTTQPEEPNEQGEQANPGDDNILPDTVLGVCPDNRDPGETFGMADEEGNTEGRADQSIERHRPDREGGEAVT